LEASRPQVLASALYGQGNTDIENYTYVCITKNYIGMHAMPMSIYTVLV